MNELKIFDNPEFGEIRTVTIDGEPWFVGKDVAVALGYENPQKAIKDHVFFEDKKMGERNVTPSIIDSVGRLQYPTFINESGIYALVFGSKLDSAKRFKHWVTSEVLPAIRKTGAYETDIAKKIRLTEKANEIASEVTEELLPYLETALHEKFSPANQPTRYSARMIITDPESKKENRRINECIRNNVQLFRRRQPR